MLATELKLKKSDWIRFQLHHDKRVLEGFIQKISADGQRLKIGKEPDGPEFEWHALTDITILRHQTLGAPF